MKKLVVFIVLLFASPATAFEVNAIWLKGDVDLAVYKKLDPTVKMDGFEIGNDEFVTLYVTYRDPARDDQNWSKVTFGFDMVNPNGQLKFVEETKREMVAGEGIITGFLCKGLW